MALLPWTRRCGSNTSPEHCAHIYERFYRAKSAGNIPGTGLGMAIVKEIMDLHEGGVIVTSVAEQGTRVSLQWPSAPAADPAES
jgi:signal transduction histidine kinase